MLLIGIVLGLVVGLLLGGRVDALVNVRLRFAALIVVAIVVRYGTQLLIGQGVELVEALRVPLYATAFGVLIGALWLNRSAPGLLVVMVGAGMNAIAILVNGGWMPVYEPALAAAGLSPADLSLSYHVRLPTDLGLDFLLHAGPLGDVIPFPVPILPNVVSLGDVLISLGLGWFVFATLLWGSPTPSPAGVSLLAGRLPARTLQRRPVVLGGGVGPGLMRPTAAPATADVTLDGAPVADVFPSAWPQRVRTHPYVRLARDARFSTFWIGQSISVFGDRLHQVALAYVVLAVTESVVLSGLVFFTSMLPNLFLSPIAGTLVDRWDHKHVMVVSDLLRAGLVILLPFVLEINVALVYPVTFLITTVSLFFRPARSAVLPRIVREDDLLTANSAMWTGETLADIGGYPMAGLLVAFLGGNVALAFWLDGATYLVSAILVASLIIPPIARSARVRIGGAVSLFLGELRDGWRFLRDSPPLFQNTLISTLGQLSLGATLALTPFYALDLLGRPAEVDGVVPGLAETYGTLEAAIGLGNLVGGFVVGAIGNRLGKGRLVVAGFVLMGISTVGMGLAGNVPLAVVAAMAIGVFNLVYVIPSQTLFGLLVPTELMGRVIAMRSSLVFGAMTGSAAFCSLAAAVVPAGVIIAALGVVTLMAGLIAGLLPAVRDA